MSDQVDMVKAIRDNLEKNSKNYPCHTNRASELGHECVRYLYYRRTEWDKAEIYTADTLMIFEEGNYGERQVLEMLAKAGVECFEQQNAFGNEALFKKLKITGHLDWKIRENGRAIPVEFKTMNSFIYDSIHTIDDMIHSNKSWIKKYPSQLTIYLLGAEEEYGYFLLKSKGDGRLKQIRMELDLELGERLLKRAEEVNRAVDAGELPDRIPYDPDVCGMCSFKNHCNPAEPREEIDFQESPVLLALLEEREESKSDFKIYGNADKKAKDMLKKCEASKVMVGPFICQIKRAKNRTTITIEKV